MTEPCSTILAVVEALGTVRAFWEDVKGCLFGHPKQEDLLLFPNYELVGIGGRHGFVEARQLRYGYTMGSVSLFPMRYVTGQMS
ncbi:uncharacterized protein ACLA_059570 [Aspergillus clavatus NRRL 1]|uniref:Uncharacterized protein n=1 Tax=Aspergillus clavatus (strain ATCC 1007 / CBS 513.65 / DSM 816 / NCTC 3887 / NRRL 1 / QM 1276 / 107) TaxID=344612 RepID=A1C4F0_ASPCL|nr:uncharacterized protein ACLA_059570 [Aspergillus clavatus NRRL 1]EAW15290.1 hypothetical protein ACLA_059570 [Aspergillus clavatus NRRL 1]